VRWRSKAFVELWADPRATCGRFPAIGLHEARGRSDRVIFTAVNWEWKPARSGNPAWSRGGHHSREAPGARRIELMTMLRAPATRRAEA